MFGKKWEYYLDCSDKRYYLYDLKQKQHEHNRKHLHWQPYYTGYFNCCGYNVYSLYDRG